MVENEDDIEDENAEVPDFHIEVLLSVQTEGSVFGDEKFEIEYPWDGNPHFFLLQVVRLLSRLGFDNDAINQYIRLKMFIQDYEELKDAEEEKKAEEALERIMSDVMDVKDPKEAFLKQIQSSPILLQDVFDVYMQSLLDDEEAIVYGN